LEFAAVARLFGELEKEALDVLRLTGAQIERCTTGRLADMRYIGQGSEITVALPESMTEQRVRQSFEAAYKALFARTPPGAAIQFVALRLSLSAPMPGSGGRLELTRHAASQAEKGTRPVFFPDVDKTLPTKVYDRYALQPGAEFAGPAVFEENESTFVVGPGATIRVLGDNSIIAEAK
jgi:N-methylhydantoinase A